MRAFLIAVLGLNSILGGAVYAQTGGGTGDRTPVKSDDTKRVEKSVDKGKADKAKAKAKGGDKDKYK